MPVPRPSVLVPDVAASAAAIAGFFGGRPRRFDPCRASIARFMLSRSAIRSATMCSVGMLGRYYHPACSSGNETCLVECKWKTSKRPIKKRVHYGRISPNQPHLWSDNSDPSRRPRIASGPGFRADQRPVNIVPDYRKVLNFLELDLGGRIRHGGTLGSVWVCTED
jgi:hypothetical protein